jgi:hypothetical protein
MSLITENTETAENWLPRLHYYFIQTAFVLTEIAAVMN